jgi:hypothetical protein
MSSRWFSSTSIEAASVMSGDRSSWLTLDANRASRSIRSSSTSAISLNDAASGARSTSSLASTRVSNRPVAMAWAASLMPRSGRSTRRAAHQPTSAPAAVASSDAASSEMLIDSSVSSSSPSDTISK